MINPSTYYTVQGWMREDLGLKDKELTVYAIIYGFSQDGSSEYSGSARYLAEWIGCSRRTIVDVLAALTEKGYLDKKTFTQNGITFCNYRALRPMQNGELSGGADSSQGMQNFHTPCADSSHPPVKKLHTPCADSSHHITRDNNRNINIEIDIGAAGAAPSPAPVVENDKKPVKHKYGEYKNVLLTDEELEKLRALFPADLQERIERLSEYIASTGKTYKSHYATIRSWANRDKKQQPRQNGRRGQAAGPMGPNGIAIDPSKTDLDGLF